jgi:hypothetical protein
MAWTPLLLQLLPLPLPLLLILKLLAENVEHIALSFSRFSLYPSLHDALLCRWPPSALSRLITY